MCGCGQHLLLGLYFRNFPGYKSLGRCLSRHMGDKNLMIPDCLEQAIVTLSANSHCNDQRNNRVIAIITSTLDDVIWFKIVQYLRYPMQCSNMHKFTVSAVLANDLSTTWFCI